MRFAAILVSVWAAWRWLGVAFGAGRARRFEGPQRREARRSVLIHAAITLFVSGAAFYLWAEALELLLTETFMGLLAAILMSALVIAVAAAFMQPQERTPETLGICRLGWRPGPDED